jgi:hypothetical protein
LNQGANDGSLPLLLNSERIIKKFGSYGIDVLQDRDRIRVSSLYSMHEGKKITRTFSVVHSPAVIDALFAQEYQEIVEGQSIGAMFKHNGWHIEKQPVFFGEIEACEDFAPVYTLMGGIAPTPLAIHIYTLIVEKHTDKFRYGVLAEVHHPEYFRLSALKEAYGQEGMASVSERVREILGVVKDKMKSI